MNDVDDATYPGINLYAMIKSVRRVYYLEDRQLQSQLSRKDVELLLMHTNVLQGILIFTQLLMLWVVYINSGHAIPMTIN